MSDQQANDKVTPEQFLEAARIIEEFNKSFESESKFTDVCEYIEKNKKLINSLITAISFIRPDIGLALARVFGALDGACAAKSN